MAIGCVLDGVPDLETGQVLRIVDGRDSEGSRTGCSPVLFSGPWACRSLSSTRSGPTAGCSCAFGTGFRTGPGIASAPYSTPTTPMGNCGPPGWSKSSLPTTRNCCSDRRKSHTQGTTTITTWETMTMAFTDAEIRKVLRVIPRCSRADNEADHQGKGLVYWWLRWRSVRVG